MKNDLLWLAIGIVVGYLLWDQSQAHHCKRCGKAGSSAGAVNKQQNFPPTCGSCGA